MDSASRVPPCNAQLCNHFSSLSSSTLAWEHSALSASRLFPGLLPLLLSSLVIPGLPPPSRPRRLVFLSSPPAIWPLSPEFAMCSHFQLFLLCSCRLGPPIPYIPIYSLTSPVSPYYTLLSRTGLSHDAHTISVARHPSPPYLIWHI